MTSRWYEDFFQGLALELWRQAIPPEETLAEADFLAAVLGARPGAHLLDVPCGNGRLAFALAGRGCRMTGVDLAQAYIAEARAGSAAEEMEWLHGDMRELPWTDRFDGAFCFGNSFAYFDREGTRDFLAAVGRALKPGARFALDTALAAESLLPGLEERSWAPAGEMMVLVERHYEIAESRLDTEYTIIHNGRSERRQAKYWIYTVAEIVRMLGESGLEAISLFESLDQKPYRFGAARLLLVAEKR